MYKKKKTMVTEQRQVVVAVVCDNCAKEHEGNEMPEDWHSFAAQHYEWGNDSCESAEKYEVCSPNCYKEKLIKAVRDFSSYDSAKIDNMTIQFAKRLISVYNSVIINNLNKKNEKI